MVRFCVFFGFCEGGGALGGGGSGGVALGAGGSRGAAWGRFLRFAVLGGAPAGARAAPGSCARWEPEQPVGARARGAMPGSPSAAGRPIGPASLFNERLLFAEQGRRGEAGLPGSEAMVLFSVLAA